ncbi:MAG: methyltransferase domain-containing protein [Bacteroidia bacterium]
MKYLNLGCGTHYSLAKEWTNIDFSSSGPGVIAHNLLKGIPFNDNSFDLVYHSHVLEHFSKEDGENLIAECYRVLKPGGILRVVIPDLEMIARNYLKYFDEGVKNPNDELIRANYEWMKLEMYDQTVRNYGGGDLAKYLFKKNIINESFVFERIGEEGKAIRNNYLESEKKGKHKARVGIKQKIKTLFLKLMGIDIKAYYIGKFRLGGEIHQWMYDRYSLSKLLELKGGKETIVQSAFTSYLKAWADYGIDGKNNSVRKPDSLFVESIKK